MRDKRLLEIMTKLTQKVIDMLQKTPEDKYPTMNELSFSSIKKNGYTMHEETKVSFHRLVSESMNEILGILEFRDFAEYVTNNKELRGKISLFGDSSYIDSPPYRITFLFSVCPFLDRYFSRINSVRFDEKVFHETYSDLENYFYSKIQRYRVSSPLANFSCEKDIQLNNELKISPISEMEMNEFLKIRHNTVGVPSPMDGMDILGFSNALETVYDHKSDTWFDISFGTKPFDETITALRLFKHGFVDYTFLRYVAESWNPTLQDRFGETNSQGLIQKTRYTLSTSEITEFILFWKKYEKFLKSTTWTKAKRYLEVALRRFNLGIEEKEIEDKVIDFLIAMEALYLHETQELTFKLSNRVAVLLGKTDEQKEEIKESVISAYSLRSAVVHGKELKAIQFRGTNVMPEIIVARIEDLLRKSILCFIKLSKTCKKQEDIAKELDRSLLSFRARKKLQRMATF